MDLPRSSGILLHPTSLPGGRLGPEARRFVDWLAAAGQSWWQVLPLGPPDEVGSPYKSTSAFAGWSGLLERPDARVSAAEVRAFRAEHAYWVEDWAAYEGAGAIEDQVRFGREWGALRAYAAERGVRLIGDLPIFVAGGSADVAAHPRLFQDDAVAGVPPDAFSDTGQLWGNPLYRWPAMRAEGFRWWIERFRRTVELVDVARIDHFRGFVAHWAVPKGHRTAQHGRWRRGPGEAPFRAAETELGPLPLIAENLGVITDAVERLRHRLELPGMVVLQWAFDGGAANPHRLERHERRSVVYTGTHDNDTSRGWWDEVADDDRRAAVDAAAAARGIDDAEPSWRLLRLALASPASLSVVPLQDVLGLGNDARMNTPGTGEGNWSWRFERGALTEALAARLRAATVAAHRHRG